MTNAHCQECGDPIFRYDGQEFCATCQRVVERETAEDGEDEGDAADENGDREEIEVAAPEDTRVRFGGETEGPADAEPEAGADEGAPARADATPDGDDATDAGADDPRGPESDGADRRSPPPRPTADVDGDLADAADSLVRSTTRLARRAADTDDLGRKRDLLAATREAAEALSAVRDAGR